MSHNEFKPLEGGSRIDLAGILAEVWAEREKQDEKWGQQNHDITNLSVERASTLCGHLRSQCDERFESGCGSWQDILLEEVYEAFEQAALGNMEDCRKELIQCAAVVVAMVECLDRNKDSL